MRLRRVFVLASAGIMAVLVVLTTPAFAQPADFFLEYKAKFVCGRQDLGGETIVGGRYRTVVNIHNPVDVTVEGVPTPITFFKHAVVALPQGNELIQPSCAQQEFLPHDHALAVSCRNIIALYAQSGVVLGRPFEGFLVIQLPGNQGDGGGFYYDTQLDVVAVYTASKGLADTGVDTMQVQEVRPRFYRPGLVIENPCQPPG